MKNMNHASCLSKIKNLMDKRHGSDSAINFTSSLLLIFLMLNAKKNVHKNMYAWSLHSTFYNNTIYSSTEIQEWGSIKVKYSRYKISFTIKDKQICKKHKVRDLFVMDK